LDSAEQEEIYTAFRDRVNMQPKELEQWLESAESQSVGDRDEGESTRHKSGKRIVAIERHLAQRPHGDIAESNWRFSLMNRGHDPLKND
jgi:hypothetical protein